MSVDQDSRVGQCAGAPAMRYRMLGFSGTRAAAAVPSTAAATTACIILATAAVSCLRGGSVCVEFRQLLSYVVSLHEISFSRWGGAAGEKLGIRVRHAAEPTQAHPSAPRS